jgi:2-polyprenyl-3-methyl-5-hydroxy-6-metoxy-1,4-benzoquinol methylase
VSPIADQLADIRPADRPPGACTLCGAALEPALTAHDRNRELSPERFDYARCTACGTLALVNVPADLGRFYPASYYELPDAGAMEGLRGVEQHKVDLLRRFVEPGRLVEIGPGAGVFAYAARRSGFDVTAVEMDERTSAHLRSAAGVEAINSSDPAGVLAGLPPSRAIAMWHVLEHLPDPDAVLAAAAANLEPGGALILGTPNPQALQFRLMGARWPHLDAPRHLFLVPLEALTQRAAAAGLRRVAVTTTDPAGRHWNLFGWEYGLRRRPAQGPPARAVALAALAFTLAMRPIEHRGMLGASYTAVFRKEPT